MRFALRKLMLMAATLAASPALAQQPQQQPDRSDPSIIEQDQDDREAPQQQQRTRPIAPPAQAGAAARGGEVVAGTIQVAGATRLSPAAFSRAIEPFRGRPLAQADLVRLATAVANVARRSGFGLATAWVPAQDLTNGILTVQVDEGRIDAVRATGPGAALVERHLAAIVGAGPVRTDELERQLLAAGDVAGMTLGEARLVRENGRNILTVSTRFQRVSGRVTLDNWGTSDVGPIRAWGEVDVNGALTAGDRLSFGVATTPAQPREFQLAEAHYRLPLGGRGTTLSAGGYYGRTDAAPDETSAGFRGDSWEVELQALHPLGRARARSLWLGGRFELRRSMLDRGGLRVREDRIATATASLFGYNRIGRGRLRSRAALVRGLDLFDATALGDPLASRSDASGVFTKFEASAEYWRPLGGGFSLELAGRVQVADGPLLSSEEIGLGGPNFLRAFDYRERSGDEGAAGSAELRFDLKKLKGALDRIQLYTYVDGGRVRDIGTDAGNGGLASAGGGVRFGLKRLWEADLGVGIPLTDGAFNPDPEPRFSFSLRAKF